MSEKNGKFLFTLLVKSKNAVKFTEPRAETVTLVPHGTEAWEDQQP